MSPFKAVRAYARLTVRYFSSNVKAAAEYRVNFVAQALGMFLNNAAFIVFWRVLIDRAGKIAGYGFEDVMFIWAVASASFGLAHIVFGNVRRLGALALSGDLDVYLLQPKNVLINASLARTQIPAWGDLIYGIVLIAAASRPDLSRWLLFALFVFTGASLYASTFVLIESLYFFLGNAQGLSQALFELVLSSTLYPDSVFPAPVRAIFYSLIPAGYIVFLPLKAFKALDLRVALISVAAAIVYAALAFMAFNAGLKRYESGNLVGTRT